jgi:GT2 family glycosyltransferase
LEHLYASTHHPFEVIVVDHGLNGETRRGLLEKFPSVIRVEGDSSLWWAAATNLGIRHALEHGNDSIVLLNNDCYVEPNMLARLVAHSAAEPQAVIAPMQVDLHSGRVQPFLSTCLLLGFPTFAISRPRRPIADTPQLIRARMIGGGRGVIVPAHIFQQIGLFDAENMPHYYADHDFYLRCRKQGVPLYIARDTTVVVDPRRTTAAANYARLNLREFRRTFSDPRSHRNLIYVRALMRKHYPIRGLHEVGVVLHGARYLLVYLVRRAWQLVRFVR